MANDVNKTFASLSWVFLLGGLGVAIQGGLAPLLLALFICYVMLTATNAISRGENRVRKR